MTIDGLNKVMGHLRGVPSKQDAAELPDGDLVERYRQQRDEAAFEALVRRHGPMVIENQYVVGHFSQIIPPPLPGYELYPILGTNLFSESETMISFSCPSCGKTYQVPDNAAGKKTACKKCNGKITVPELEEEIEEEAIEPVEYRRIVDDDEQEETPKPPKIKKSATFWIWLAVAVWWTIPPIWFLCSLVYAGLSGSGADPFGGARMTTAQMLWASGGLMMLAFIYAVWCAVGVVCGIGLERFIETFRGKR